MPLFRYLFLILALSAVLACPAAAADDPAQALTAAMQRRYETLKSFEAAFTQTLTNAASGESSTRTGTIRFKRPRLIRWQTVSPEPELLIMGSQDVWTWFEQEETAYRYTAEQVLDSRTMLRFIAGDARLDEDFWVEGQGEEGGLSKLQLTARKPEPSMVEATVWVDPAQAVMTKISIIDFFGNVNTVTLENLKIDVDLPEGIFTFTPPKGADVFDNRGKEGPKEETLGN